MARKIDPDLASRALSAMLRDILASGHKPLDAPEVTDAVAVHDLRKAFKRWRAILRLIAPVVGEEAETLRIEARDLARQMATARDGRAALEAFAHLGDDAGTLSPRTRATITERLTGLGASAEAATLTPALKAQVGAALARAALAIEQWPLDRFDAAAATKRLTATYRRVRAAMPDDWSSAHPEALHGFRQRVVEHRYQMELVEAVWPKLIRLWTSEAQRLRDRLGSYQDLVLLQRLTAPHQPLAPWRSRLAPLIAARQADQASTAERLAGRLFAEKPKAFHRRIAALWKHRVEK
jgi:CHAD domain-containing protein